jgi:hypothetical protein
MIYCSNSVATASARTQLGRLFSFPETAFRKIQPTMKRPSRRLFHPPAKAYSMAAETMDLSG